MHRTQLGGRQSRCSWLRLGHAPPCLITPAGELGLLRMAIDTVAGALCRQSFERERSRLELRLQQARRMETVGTFASGIAHNLNNIVGAILGYTEMADERQSAAGILPAIRQACERARELVDQILTFARCRDVHRHPVSVQALAAETSSLLRASLPTTVELVANDISEELTVSGVHAQLQQVILNLCSNAAQAMDHVGRVELQIGACDVAEARSLSHGSLAPGRHVRMAVSDTGRGIVWMALAWGWRRPAKSCANMVARYNWRARWGLGLASRSGCRALPRPFRLRSRMMPGGHLGTARPSWLSRKIPSSC
jgi:signal transduction histidine kinase